MEHHAGARGVEPAADGRADAPPAPVTARLHRTRVAGLHDIFRRIREIDGPSEAHDAPFGDRRFHPAPALPEPDLPPPIARTATASPSTFAREIVAARAGSRSAATWGARCTRRASATTRPARRKLGDDGDFITAPEISPMFGKCLALQARQCSRLRRGDILELGAGLGRAGRGAFGELEERGALPRATAAGGESGRCGSGSARRLVWQRFRGSRPLRVAGRAAGAIKGTVVANEVLDVVPVSLVARGRERSSSAA